MAHLSSSQSERSASPQISVRGNQLWLPKKSARSLRTSSRTITSSSCSTTQCLRHPWRLYRRKKLGLLRATQWDRMTWMDVSCRENLSTKSPMRTSNYSRQSFLAHPSYLNSPFKRAESTDETNRRVWVFVDIAQLAPSSYPELITNHKSQYSRNSSSFSNSEISNRAQFWP